MTIYILLPNLLLVFIQHLLPFLFIKQYMAYFTVFTILFITPLLQIFYIITYIMNILNPHFSQSVGIHYISYIDISVNTIDILHQYVYHSVDIINILPYVLK